jgi:plasmid stabilization system protein ParE
LKRRIVVRPEARDELSEAAAWYRQKSPALAASFRAAVRQTISFISRWPDASVEVTDGVRRALTNQFPYAVFYSEESPGIIILSIKHQVRDPVFWPKGT